MTECARVVVVGSANCDCVTRAAAFPQPGETVLGSDVSFHQGGKGANQAIAAAKSGARTVFIGAVGSDVNAAVVTDSLREAGVDLSVMRTVEGPTGFAAITVTDDGENNIIVVPGANNHLLTLTDAERAAIADADVVMLQFEIPMGTVVEAAAHARRNSTVVMVNPSPFAPIPADLLPLIDVLVVNEGECRTLGDQVISELPAVVTTLGSAGVEARVGGELFSVAGQKVSVVDTTGAGDAFTGALASRWLAGPALALRYANAAGAFAATHCGAGSSSGTTNDIVSMLK